MYSYSWDAATGGLLLNSSPLQFSKEPRPVYYKELDILGFDQYWKYDRNDSYPYMWAEANNYFYRGRLVAKTKGGSLYTAPELIVLEEPEPNGAPLRFVDIPAMVEKNRDLLEKLVQDTIKKIYNTYVEYRDKVDVQKLKSRLKRAGIMTEWKAFYALASTYLGMPDIDSGFMCHDSRFDKKADRIMEFVLKAGNMGHNRDMSHFSKKPYLIGKCVSMGRRVGDLINHARIFPLDSLRIFPRIMWNGVRSAIRGE